MPISDYFLRINSPRGKDVYIFFGNVSPNHITRVIHTKKFCCEQPCPGGLMWILYFQAQNSEMEESVCKSPINCF